MKYSIAMNGTSQEVTITQEPSMRHCTIHLGGEDYSADVQRLGPGRMSVIINGRSYSVLSSAEGEDTTVVVNQQRFRLRIDDPRSLRLRRQHKAASDGPRPVMAPMPGRVVRILVQPGDLVEAQQSVIVIEAMKMQNELKAQKAGRVTRIAVQPGASVQPGETLIAFE